jgi:hypothetical protein
VLVLALTRMICHTLEARRDEEARHGIETGRIVMTPEEGFTEIREPVASVTSGAVARSASGTHRRPGPGSSQVI